MLDTNILLSASLFPNERINKVIDYIVREHTLVLSDLVTNEFLDVAAYEKFDRVKDAQKFLGELSYTEYKTPKVTRLKGVSIRDEDDYDILFSAIKSETDIFITGDKDFLECEVSKPRMMTMNEFAILYING